MYRRALLAAIAAAGGCTAPTPRRSPTRTTTAVPTPPPDSCPPPGLADRTVCDASRPVRTTADPTTARLPRDELQFTLRNESDRAVLTRQGDRQLWKWTDDRWQFLTPKGGTGELPPPVELPPGGTRRLRLQVNTADLGAVQPAFPDADRTIRLRLTPGTYAFGFEARRQTAGTTPGTGTETGDAFGDTSRLYTTRFTVAGDGPGLPPTDRVTSRTRDGDTLTVRSERPAEPDDARRVTLRMDRVTAPDAARLTTLELLNPFYALITEFAADSYLRLFPPTLGLVRDGLALAEPSDRTVLVRTREDRTPFLGDSRRLRYEDSGWELTGERGW